MRRFALLVMSGPQARTRIPVLAPIVIGREQADVAIHDPLVSRRHLRLRPLTEALEVEDLRSLNGTSVGGAPLRGVRRLVDGEVVYIGETRIEILVERVDSAAPAREAPSAAPGEPVFHFLGCSPR